MTVWILRDLSNGDGADGRQFPTYVWAFRTRHWAREVKRVHARNPRTHARLGPVERWPSEELLRRYNEIGIFGDGSYWWRKL